MLRSLVVLLLTGCGGVTPAPQDTGRKEHPGEAQQRGEARGACEPFTLRFAPRERQRYTHRYSITKSKTLREAEPITETIQLEEEVELKPAGEGYVLTTRPKAAVTSRSDGKPVSAITYVPYETPLTYRISKEGRALEVRGFEGILERVGAVSANDRQALERAGVTAAFLEQARMSEWSGAIADLVGIHGCVGDAFKSEAIMPLPIGTVSVTSAVRFTAFTECSLGRCLIMERVYDLDAKPVASWLGGSVLKRATPVGVPYYFGSATTILEPSTLRLVHLEAERSFAVTMQESGAQVHAGVVERHVHDNEYHD